MVTWTHRNTETVTFITWQRKTTYCSTISIPGPIRKCKVEWKCKPGGWLFSLFWRNDSIIMQLVRWTAPAVPRSNLCHRKNQYMGNALACAQTEALCCMQIALCFDWRGRDNWERERAKMKVSAARGERGAEAILFNKVFTIERRLLTVFLHWHHYDGWMCDSNVCRHYCNRLGMLTLEDRWVCRLWKSAFFFFFLLDPQPLSERTPSVFVPAAWHTGLKGRK